ncbi:hypothetical protein HYQ44_020156 [Verticillium longisporum]|nr:hypothetical protein HYQ44_020156 [Verticillium longisporum]
MLEGWETEYEGVKSGYDDAWPTYEQYIRDAVEPAISKIMTEKDGVATKFFKCWRFDDGVNENQKHRAREISCTGDDRFWGPQLFRSFWFDLIDVAGFNATLEEAGVDPEENLVVPNPKDLVGKAFEGVNSLHEALSSSSLDVGADIWHGSPTELFDVLAVPVLMVGDAIESMKEIKDIAKKVNDAKKKDLIMLIIESILMVLPLVGVIVGQAGRAGLMAAHDIAANISATPFDVSAGNFPYPSGSASGLNPSTPAPPIDHPTVDMFDSSEWGNPGNEMWYLPPGAAFFQNMENGVAMTSEGLNVGGVDLLEYMAMDPQFPVMDGANYGA